MSWFLIFFLSLLVACNTPSLALRGGARDEVTLDDVRFTVWHDRQRAEVIRHGYLGRQDQAGLRPLMMNAARAATGCAIRAGSVEGDTGVLRMVLDCRAPP